MKRFVFVLFSFGFSFPLFAQVLKDCGQCATNLITEKQIEGLSMDELAFLTNDLFARKGYQFQRADIQSYYMGKSWYKPAKDNHQLVYNAIEKQNIKLFQQAFSLLKSDHDKLIQTLEELKATFIKPDWIALKTNFDINPSIEGLANFQQTLQKIDLKDVNWVKHRGNYVLTIDNGSTVMSYALWIDQEKVVFKCNMQGSSSFSEDIYPNDYVSEYAESWVFSWDQRQLKYLDYVIAG